MEEITTQNYHEAVAFLEAVPRFTRKNAFEETKAFYEYIQQCDGENYEESRLGKIVHVAGTNGKGSVCAFLQQICVESGYRTAMFTSPHLVTIRERFRINGEVVSEALFVEAFNWLTRQLRAYRHQKPEYCPAYFERLFFMGIYIFCRADVAVTILETGLGGRLDTTNVVKSPAITIITEIGLDHMAYLGDTVTQIAGEKAGIIKPGIPVIFADRKKEASAVLCKKASDYKCKTVTVSKNDYKINEIQKKYIDFSVVSRYYDYCGLKTNTLAVYQAENAALAIKACELLQMDCGLNKITGETIQKGIWDMRWAGRMEEIAPRVYIDGAHNEDGIEAFVQSVKNMPGVRNTKCILIFSAVKDKQYELMAQMLCGLSAVTEFVITHIPDERGVQLKDMKEKFRKYTEKSVCSYENIEEAIEYSLSARGATGMVFIVGSLYLAGLVEQFMDKRNESAILSAREHS